MPPNPGHLPPNVPRADLKFRNGHIYRNVERLDQLRWSITGASSDITHWQRKDRP